MPWVAVAALILAVLAVAAVIGPWAAGWFEGLGLVFLPCLAVSALLAVAALIAGIAAKARTADSDDPERGSNVANGALLLSGGWLMLVLIAAL